jgi:hypothetical protein
MISQLVLGKSFECSENDMDQFKFLTFIRDGTVVQLVMSVFLEIKSALHGLTRLPALRPYMTFFPHPGHEEGIGRVMRVCSALELTTFTKMIRKYNSL